MGFEEISVLWWSFDLERRVALSERGVGLSQQELRTHVDFNLKPTGAFSFHFLHSSHGNVAFSPNSIKENQT